MGKKTFGEEFIGLYPYHAGVLAALNTIGVALRKEIYPALISQLERDLEKKPSRTKEMTLAAYKKQLESSTPEALAFAFLNAGIWAMPTAGVHTGIRRAVRQKSKKGSRSRKSRRAKGSRKVRN